MKLLGAIGGVVAIGGLLVAGFVAWVVSMKSWN